MIQQTPSEEELKNRITQHLEAMPGNNGVIIAWLGYLFALVEWGAMDINAHRRLVQLLPPDIGSKEMEIIMLGIDDEGK